MQDNDQKNQFSGAWLTDIDDTLIRSGLKPDDEWIESLIPFIRTLKDHNIAWVPVSGVALAKMGPRMLYRLPEDLLSHVMYYGGEGSTKSLFDPELQKWVSPEKYQRNFSDAQTLYVIGEERFANALKISYEARDTNDQRIQQRISAAQEALKDTRYVNMPSLIDEVEDKLTEAGFDCKNAETYFRGGALSWMMLGDISVQNYKGVHETATREALNLFLRERLEALDFLKDIGENGIHMPYLHATRGIKLVLMGNDKGRAADDLIQNEQIPSEAILFVGNELYDGGNDNTVRRVEGLTLLSVGENADPGVILGGVQVESNRHWMDWAVNHLQQGSPWVEILKALPAAASGWELRSQIEQQKKLAQKMSPWHQNMSQTMSTDFLAELYYKYHEKLGSARKQLIKLRKIQYDLVARLAVLEQYHYDNARKIIHELFSGSLEEQDQELLSARLKQYLLPELKQLLRQFFIEQLNIKEKRVCRQIDKITGMGGLNDGIDLLLSHTENGNRAAEETRVKGIIETWENKIDKLVESSIYRQRKTIKGHSENRQQIEDSITPEDGYSKQDGYRFFKWLLPRLDDLPHLKDLDKPTIILVAGTSGVGKSTLSRQISKTMGIPTSFSSDVASRSVMRESIAFLLGNDRASELYPEVFGSSFAEDNLEWFYGHSLLTMVGVAGNINRLIKENISAVIDGVALIPGTLPEVYFEKANIVWIVASVGDMNSHHDRLGTRSETGVERGGADRYRESFPAIRRNHDRLVEMAQRTDALTVDNSGQIETAIAEVLQRVADPFADRGLLVEDHIRDKIHNQLQERTTWEVQNTLVQDTA